MALRLIEMAVSSDIGACVDEYVKDYNIIGIWRQDLNDGNMLVRVLLTAQDAEKVLDLSIISKQPKAPGSLLNVMSARGVRMVHAALSY